jgi:hypothetical protein
MYHFLDPSASGSHGSTARLLRLFIVSTTPTHNRGSSSQHTTHEFSTSSLQFPDLVPAQCYYRRLLRPVDTTPSRVLSCQLHPSFLPTGGAPIHDEPTPANFRSDMYTKRRDSAHLCEMAVASPAHLFWRVDGSRFCIRHHFQSSRLERLSSWSRAVGVHNTSIPVAQALLPLSIEGLGPVLPFPLLSALHPTPSCSNPIPAVALRVASPPPGEDGRMDRLIRMTRPIVLCRNLNRYSYLGSV